MKVALINGSPKTKGSASSTIFSDLKDFLKDAVILEYSFRKGSLNEEDLNEVSKCEALVFAFPLYVDGIPSHMLRCLLELEGFFKGKEKRNIKVYSLINCGFYEGHQNNVAMEMMENWCSKAGLIWGQGLSIGAGGMLSGMSNLPAGHGPKKNLGKALKELGENISKGNSGENLCINPNFPRLLYKLSGNYSWIQEAKKSGLKRKDLNRKL